MGSDSPNGIETASKERRLLEVVGDEHQRAFAFEDQHNRSGKRLRAPPTFGCPATAAEIATE